MISAFSTALSGLNADSTAIDVIGNDLANLNTTGYKATELQFSDLMSEQLGVSGTSGQLGMGIGQLSTQSAYTQGSIQTTNGPTDAAIQGNGFFVVQNQNAQTLYTRDGSFSVNSTGQLVDASGDLVQGWSATAGGSVNTNSAIGNISLPLGTTIAATPTTTMSLGINLNATPSTTSTPATFSAPIKVVDSLGTSHTLTATFTNTGANAWSYSLSVPASDLTSGGNTTVASGTLTFDSSGQLTTPDATSDPQPVQITGLADGAADMSIGLNLFNPATGASNITQFAEASAVSNTTQNGFAAGQINSVSLQNGGLLVATYSNGQQVTAGQLAIASISNPDTLTAVGNNDLAASAQTAAPVVGTANTGSRGQIVAGALESSTVDIAQEFTQLLTFERSYQANSRVITTDDQIQQETINLVHA
jgi:flagellar hook protein FlgE